MLLVVDANVLFSALIKESGTAELLISDKIELTTPEFILSEFQEHKKEILNKTHRNEEDFYKFLLILENKIEVIPSSELKSFLNKARVISPDIGDVPYFAAAIKCNCPIWSEDKELRKQNKIKVYSTSELLKIIK